MEIPIIDLAYKLEDSDDFFIKGHEIEAGDYFIIADIRAERIGKIVPGDYFTEPYFDITSEWIHVEVKEVWHHDNLIELTKEQYKELENEIKTNINI